MEFEDAAQTYKEIKDFDAIDTAERIFGVGEVATNFGIALFMENNARKREALEAMGDTHYNSSYAFFMEKAIQFGFQEIYHQEFQYKTRIEQYKVFWNSMGVLLVLESYGNSVNNANIYFNWKSSNSKDPYQRPNGSNSSWIGKNYKPATIDDFYGWAVSLDVREGFISKMVQLGTEGQFLPNWSQAPFLWLCNFSETKEENYDYKAIRDLKVSQFPEHVCEAIGDPSGDTIRETK